MGMLFFAIAVVVLLLILTRAIALWYWKIDRIVNLLERIEENTRTVASVAPGAAVSSVTTQEKPRKQSLKDVLNAKIF